MDRDPPSTPEDLFRDHPEGLAICRAVERALAEIGDVSMGVTRNQVAFRRRRGFAYVWRPGRYVDSGVPAVLSLAVPPEVDQVDDEIREWLAEAYSHAG